MDVLKKLRAELANNVKQHEMAQRIMKRSINSQLKIEQETQEDRILKNYNMGMLTLHEMISQRIDVLKQLFDNAYTYEETKTPE